jgi:hypothetical protein
LQLARAPHLVDYLPTGQDYLIWLIIIQLGKITAFGRLSSNWARSPHLAGYHPTAREHRIWLVIIQLCKITESGWLSSNWTEAPHLAGYHPTGQEHRIWLVIIQLATDAAEAYAGSPSLPLFVRRAEMAQYYLAL